MSNLRSDPPQPISVSPLVFKALTLMAKRKEVSIEELTIEILTQGIKARVEVRDEYIAYEDGDNEEGFYEYEPDEPEVIQSLLDMDEEESLGIIGITYTHEEVMATLRKFVADYTANQEQTTA